MCVRRVGAAAGLGTREGRPSHLTSPNTGDVTLTKEHNGKVSFLDRSVNGGADRERQQLHGLRFIWLPTSRKCSENTSVSLDV